MKVLRHFSLWCRNLFQPSDDIPLHVLFADGRMLYDKHPLRSSFSAAMQAVAQPQNGSNTRSPGLDEALIICSNNATGFCVFQPVYSPLWVEKFVKP